MENTTQRQQIRTMTELMHILDKTIHDVIAAFMSILQSNLILIVIVIIHMREKMHVIVVNILEWREF